MKKTLGLCLSFFFIVPTCFAININPIDAVSRQPIKGAQVTVYSTNTSNPLEFVRQAVSDKDGQASIGLPDDSNHYWLNIYKPGFDAIKLTIDSTSLSLGPLLRPLRTPTTRMFSSGSIKVTINVLEYESLAALEANRGIPSSNATIVTTIFRIGDQLVGVGHRFGEEPFAQIAYGYTKRSDNSGSTTLYLPANSEINFSAFKSGYLPSLKAETINNSEKTVTLTLIKVGE